MILRSLHLQRFGRFRDASWEFRPGLNVIRGPNEAGKSTMREAIVRLLFDRTKVTTTSRDFLGLRAWGATQAFALACSFAVDGEEFALSRDFAARAAELRAPEGVLTDDELIAERLHDLLGVSSREVYETTACVRQAEFAALGAGREVSDLLQQTLAGPGAQAGVQGALDDLADRAKVLAVGLKGAYKTPGPVKAAELRIADLDGQLARLRPIVAQAEDARQRLETATERQGEVARELEQANDLLARVERRGELQRRLDDLSGRCTKLDSTVRRARELEREVADLEATLATLPDLSEEQVQVVRDLEADRAQAEQALPAEVERAEELAATAADAEGALQAAQAGLPDTARVRRAEELDREIARAEKELAIARESALAAGVELSAAEGAGRSRRNLLVAAAAAVVVGAGLALVASLTWAWAIAALGVIAGVYGLAAYRGAPATDLSDRRAQAEARAEELRGATQAMSEELAALLGGDRDIGALRERLDAGGAALQQARDQAAGARAAATGAQESAGRARQRLEIAQARLDKRLADLAFETLAAVLAAAEKVFAARAKLGDAGATLRGLLSGRPVAELDEEFARLNADRLGLQAELEKPELALAQMDAERYGKLQARVRDLTREQDALAAQIDEARAAARHPEADPERLRSLDEQQAAAAERLERLRERLDALRLAHELLEQAHRETLTSAIEVLEPRSAELLPGLTCGRYQRISFDRATLAPSVYSPEKGEDVDPDAELSCATREQVYLAARLALTRLLWPEACPPIMLDDPLVNFDPVRQQQALGIIRALASEAQVLLFTCDETYDAAADHVIVLERD